jgi:heme A synthase
VWLALVLLSVLLVQMLVGEIQYRNALPWGLVLVHVTLAATIWALTVGVAYTLWRPPLALVARSTERVEALGEPLRSR